jgi:hypothetical protein
MSLIDNLNLTCKECKSEPYSLKAWGSIERFNYYEINAIKLLLCNLQQSVIS